MSAQDLGVSARLEPQTNRAAVALWSAVAKKAGYDDESQLEPANGSAAVLLSPFWQLVSVLERAVALSALILLSPLFAVVAVLVFALSGRSPFIAHKRVGHRGRDLWVVKFRTMWGRRARQDRPLRLLEKISEEPPLTVKPRIDARVPNGFARFCRRHSIDELPQLWHVVRGEMSLVGARPITGGEMERHYGDDASLLKQFRPGITGLWQVKGRNRLTYRQRRRLDLFLLRHWTPRLYFHILTATIPRVLLGRDAW